MVSILELWQTGHILKPADPLRRDAAHRQLLQITRSRYSSFAIPCRYRDRQMTILIFLHHFHTKKEVVAA
jgi:hypothetical protein